MVDKFYCQLDFEHVPYPSPTSPNGTIADNGCGVCATSMMIESMHGIDFSIEECAAFLKRCGAREGYGTDYYIGAGAVAGHFDLEMCPTEDIEAVMTFLHTYPDGKVIANVRGDREGYLGIFADSGHYVLLDGANGDEIRVYDSMYRPGRYDLPHRVGKVRMEGFAAYADKAILRDDCFERPYFLFRKMK